LGKSEAVAVISRWLFHYDGGECVILVGSHRVASLSLVALPHQYRAGSPGKRPVGRYRLCGSDSQFIEQAVTVDAQDVYPAARRILSHGNRPARVGPIVPGLVQGDR